ncbi:MAG: S4 domain-containing protein YaaA [Deltaproteobacteria bacterium]|nr:MAG: S4 domain-containing protein YaaA [Deltaproteobacteria bacterium]
MIEVGISTEYIKLDQLLKLADLVAGGGEAKVIIQSGEVSVNGETETRRGRKLRPGDSVVLDGAEVLVAAK